MNYEKNRDRLCVFAIIAAVIICIVQLVGCFFFAPKESATENINYLSTDYVEHIFDDSYVHEIDIRLPKVNWDYLCEHAEEEQYVLCDIVVDGEVFPDVAIRPKGNSSLKAIKTQDSDRFSFKIEFDHYRTESTYYGLDKLALNNLGQDVSAMKDYLTYHMMNEIGIAAPLSSYTMVKLNGEDFGLYLAVEAIEDSFALRNYGTEHGNIYMPECFEIHSVTPKAFMNTSYNPFETDFTNLGPGDRADILGTFIKTPFENAFGENMEVAAFKYVGEDIKRYNVMFDSSVYELSKADKLRFIDTVKRLNSSDNPADAVDMDSLIRYFIVHNFVNNYDGYTGVFVHNYYVREYDGKLSMIPWDYNLAFGIFTFDTAIKSFMGPDSPYSVELKVGQAMSDAKGMINYPIDTPAISVDMSERPLMSVVFDNPTYLKQYHDIFEEFLDEYFESGKFEETFEHGWNNIAPYIEKGYTFYDYDRAVKGAKAVHDYCILREKSIRGQLDGTIPTTMEGQSEDYRNLIDDEGINLADSVTFDSLVFGIKGSDIVEILDAIAGKNEHSSQGVETAIAEATKDSSKIGEIILRVVTSSSLIKNGIASAVKGPVLLIVSLIIFAVAYKRVKKYSRRNSLRESGEMNNRRSGKGNRDNYGGGDKNAVSS